MTSPDHVLSAAPATKEVGGALHVLTLTPFFPSAGDEVSGCFIAESLEALKQQNVTSTVIAATPLHRPRKWPNPDAPADWVRYLQFPGNLGLSSAGRLLDARLQARVQQLCRSKRIDIIHAHAALPCGHAAALLAKQCGIPFVVTVHGLDVFNTCFMGGMPAAWRGRVSIDVYRQARTVICISEKVRNALRVRMQDDVRTAVVYNGTDPQRFSPAPSPKPQQGSEVLVVGNLLQGKGHELLLTAIARLRSFFPQVRCRIVGEGPDRARFSELVNRLGIAEQVQFLGRFNRNEVADAMRSCTLFALPSTYEGLGCVYLEAMSCGKPVIACQGQGIDEIVEHGKNGWLIPVNGLDQLVRGLSTLLSSAELRSQIGRAARQTILDKFTLSHQAQELARVYQEAMRGAHR